MCCSKHLITNHPSLEVKARDGLPNNIVHIAIMYPLGRKHWPSLEEKGFLRSFPLIAMSLFPVVLSCNSKGRKGGNSMKTKRWKDWYIPSNLYWWAGGDSIILSENEEMSWNSWDHKNAQLKPQIWTGYIQNWTVCYLKSALMAHLQTHKRIYKNINFSSKKQDIKASSLYYLLAKRFHGL